jgi:hypothetical protein
MTLGPVLPPWADELRRRYLAGEASLFLLHGNVRDVVPWVDDGGEVVWLDLRRFLERFLGRTRDIVAYYNISQGLLFPSDAQEQRFKRAIDAGRLMERQPALDGLPRLPGEAVPVIEELITNPGLTSGVVIDFLETIAPNSDLSFMGESDKANLVSLQRW